MAEKNKGTRDASVGRSNNPDHKMNFDSSIILNRSNQVTKLSIKGTLHISKTEPQLNAGNQSLPLYRFNA